MALSQKEIAAYAGVSCATVSRVIRTPELVRPELANRVYSAMRALGMEIKGREVVEEKRVNVLVVVQDFTYSLYGGFLEGISETANEKGLNVVLCNSGGDIAVEMASVANASRGGYVGIIFITAEDTTEYRRMLSQISLPVVLLNRKIEGLDYDSVLLAHFETARMAARQLFDMGHRHIAMLSTDTESTNTRMEKAGFIDAQIQHGISYPAAESSIYYFPNTYRGGRDFAVRYCQENMKYTALYVISSEQTVGIVIERLRQQNQSLDQLQILALNRSPILGTDTRNLITWAQPVQEMGRKALDVLLERAMAPERDRMNVQYNALADVRQP